MLTKVWVYGEKKNVKSRVWIHFGIFRCNDKGYIKYGYGNKGLWLGNTKQGYKGYGYNNKV